MFLSPAVYKIISLVFTGCLLALGLYTLGNTLIFDQLYFIFLSLIALYVRKNINLLGIIAILILAKALEQLVFTALALHDSTQWALYFFSLLSFLAFKKERCFKYFTLLMCLSLASDLYASYSLSPHTSIIWYLFLTLNAFITRRLIMKRPFITAKYFPEKVEPIALDHFIYALFGILIWVNILICAALLTFNVINIDNATLLQNSYIYLVHFIMFTLLFSVRKHSIRIIRQEITKF